jgi:hypothetical protein
MLAEEPAGFFLEHHENDRRKLAMASSSASYGLKMVSSAVV